MTEPLILVRFPCQHCNGVGRVKAAPIIGGMPAPGDETEICRACEETGFEREEWVPISRLDELRG